MSFYLLTFNRATRELDIERIDDAELARDRLRDVERRTQEMKDLEVVLLSASDEDELRRTHSRYFETFEELLAEASS